MAYPSSENSGAAVRAFRVVVLSSGDVIEAANNTTQPFGVTQEHTAEEADKPITIEHPVDRVKLTASAAIAKGAAIMCADSSAAGRIATYSAGAGVYRLGYALEAAAADGDVIECMYLPEQPTPA